MTVNENPNPTGPQDDTAPKDGPNPDEQLGEGGKKALDSEREARKAAESSAKELQKQLDAATAALNAAKTDGLPEWQQQINDLKAQIDSEHEAREAAEGFAQSERVAALRARLGKDLPDPIAALLRGETEEEIKAEVEALAPHVTAGGPKTNPQQGVPSQGRGGGISAGRDRYAAAHQK